MKYSRQLIVDGFLLNTERQRALFLTTKAQAKVPPVPTQAVLFPRVGMPKYATHAMALRLAMANLDKGSRIYLIGHGSWKSQTVGGFSPELWANTLVDSGMPKEVAVISITACNAGRDLGSSNEIRVTDVPNSFASRFHAQLVARRNTSRVYARSYTMRIRSGTDGSYATGQKTSSDGTAHVHHRPNSKILFYWENGQQHRKFVTYGQPDPNEWLDVDEWADNQAFAQSLMMMNPY